MANPGGERQTYTIEEFARLLGIGRNQAYEGARRGDFPTIRAGRRILIPRVAGNRLLAEGNAPSNRSPATAE